jgi:hypothetical protein
MCGVLRLRSLAMIESIRRAEHPAWRERLEQRQLVARLGRIFGRNQSPLAAMLGDAHGAVEEGRAIRSGDADTPDATGTVE